MQEASFLEKDGLNVKSKDDILLNTVHSKEDKRSKHRSQERQQEHLNSRQSSLQNSDIDEILDTDAFDEKENMRGTKTQVMAVLGGSRIHSRVTSREPVTTGPTPLKSIN